MRGLYSWIVGATIGVGLMCASVVQADVVHWQPTLDAAKRVAAQTNRPVLIHFWAEWCGPCRQMERTVFSRQDVAAAIESQFVPVKINQDEFPYTAQQFKVSGIPCDVVITPQGQVLRKMTGAVSAEVYLQRINQIAAAYRSTANRQLAANPTSVPREEALPSGVPQNPVLVGNSPTGSYGPIGPQPGQSPAAPATNTPSPWNAPVSAGPGGVTAPMMPAAPADPSLVGPRYASQMPTNYGPVASAQVPASAQAPQLSAGFGGATTSGLQETPARPAVASAQAGLSPSVPSPWSRPAMQPTRSPAPSAAQPGGVMDYRPGPSVNGTPTENLAMQPAVADDPMAELERRAQPATAGLNVHLDLPPGVAVEQSSTPPVVPETRQPAGRLTAEARTPSGPVQPHGTMVTADATAGQSAGLTQAPVRPPVGNAVTIPPGNPPLGLEGYCPVSLTEKGRWVLGNRRWGARHEGRTYLFAGPVEQQKFLADPERYAPVLAGIDVVKALDSGRVEEGRREFGAWYRDRVYLFADEESFERFNMNPERYVQALPDIRRIAFGAGGTGNIAVRPRYDTSWNTVPAQPNAGWY
ncbi:hypothetical protein JCM19992_12670 [Thermostilla marina]